MNIISSSNTKSSVRIKTYLEDNTQSCCIKIPICVYKEIRNTDLWQTFILSMNDKLKDAKIVKTRIYLYNHATYNYLC